MFLAQLFAWARLYINFLLIIVCRVSVESGGPSSTRLDPSVNGTSTVNDPGHEKLGPCWA